MMKSLTDIHTRQHDDFNCSSLHKFCFISRPQKTIMPKYVFVPLSRIPLLQDGHVLLWLHVQLSRRPPGVPQGAQVGHRAGDGDKGRDRPGRRGALRADDHAGVHSGTPPERPPAGDLALPRHPGGYWTVPQPYTSVGASQRRHGCQHRLCCVHTSVAET